MNRSKKLLLWLAVLPGSMLSGILSLILLHLVLYFTLRNFVQPYPELPERLLTPPLFTFIFIYAGAFIAPKFKFATAIALFSILLFVMGGMIFLTWMDTPYFGKKLSFLGNGVGPLLGIAGCFLSLYLCHKHFSNSTTADRIDEPPAVLNRKAYTIVHVDDHRLFLDGVKTVLSEYQDVFNLRSFSNTYAARDYLRMLKDNDSDIDCIITGFNQPGLNGYEFAKAVKQMYARPVATSAIILLSMFAGNEDMKQSLEKWKDEGLFDAYLSKTATADEIVQTIKAVVDRRSSRSLQADIAGK